MSTKGSKLRELFLHPVFNVTFDNTFPTQCPKFMQFKTGLFVLQNVIHILPVEVVLLKTDIFP
jgi:hypothetical protein